MSKSKDSGSSGSFHQEYIASLRYRNDLPPPDMPPKFLDIPHEGLQRFLTPGFASNLARREEPNIDVDAEGGMPIDLVGSPGRHLGDESGKPKCHLRFLSHIARNLTQCSYYGT
jgi:RNA polymerase II-associated factor 1